MGFRRMARSTLCLWSCLFWALLYTGVHGDLKQETDDKMQLFVMNNNFAVRLYKSIKAQSNSQSKNVFFSPLSVSVALSALSLGARGKTYEQVFSGLGFNSSVHSSEEVHQAVLSLLQTLNQRTGVDLEVGTALYIQDTFKPRPEFLQEMKRFYLSDGFSVDFTKCTETTEQINKYVSEKTRGKISKFTEDLDPRTIMYLLSYIYFKGKWIIPFHPKLTRERDFHVDNETTVPVQMMYRKDYYEVFHDQELSTDVLYLHYNDSFSMMLALPEKDLAALEETLSSQHIAKWLRQVVKSRKYEIYIPKLSLKTSYSLKDILKGMGMTDMFKKKANFTGISSKVDAYVSEAVHKATLDVDETGATATAVTGLGFRPLSWTFTPILDFNHPFMMFVVDRKSKNVLFMGKVTNPAASM
ncbi:hibernation-specific plasma protein HP-55-like isoform X1 [Hoplias malabaricus]|uniref:hibernation-specific plasma protein HP-55-like isoform X1 n=2 Tax=Hoplias malabaricus TaxID=27720 RepID=UPI0034634DCB